MFVPERWAEAFVRTLGKDAEEGLVFFRILGDAVSKMPGAVFGSSAAVFLDGAVSRAAEEIGLSRSRSLEGASCLMALLVKQNLTRHLREVTAEIGRFLDMQNNIVTAVFESVVTPAPELEGQIKAAIKKRTGAGEVRLEQRLKPELIGGYRLKIGDELVDASIRSQLQQMENALAAGSDSWRI